MTPDELHEALRQKVDLRWSEYEAEILRCTPTEIFNHAEEIASARFCRDQLTESARCYPPDYLEYLLRFDDPLAVVRDQWTEAQNVDYSDEFEHALWTIQNTQDAEQDYPLDPDWNTGQAGPSMY